MGVLDGIGLAQGTDKASDGHDYLTVYEPLIPRETPVRLLEIGWHQGASMRMWREWLHPASIIVGVDVTKPAEPVDRVHFRHVDATSPDMKDVIREFDAFDVVVDDGSHLSADVITSFAMLWPHVAPGGLYIVEDLQVSYHPAWGGWDPTSPTRGRRRGDTSMEFLKRLTDDVHHSHADAGPTAPTYTGVGSVAFHPGVAIIRKAGV